MPLITFNLKFIPDPPDTTVRVIVAKAKTRDTPAVPPVNYDPPHINPRLVSIYVPTFESYIVYVYKNATESSNGILINDWAVEPRADVTSIPVDTQMEVGRGQPVDPNDGDGFKIIPGSEGLQINRIHKLGLGVLPSTDWQQISGVDGDGNPAIGFELLGDDEAGNSIVFNDGEQFTIEYKIYIDANASALIGDLSGRLDDHINDHNNPHEVDKNDVGLGNLPNAKSDSYTLNDPNTLATSAAVNALRLSIVDAILYKGQLDIGVIGANQDHHRVITHNLNITPAQYIVIGSLEGYSSSWTNDNDTTFTISTKTNNAFYVDVHQLGSSSATLKFNFIILRL